MTKIFPNTQLTFRTTVKNNGALVTPATITFQWKIGRFGEWHSETPVAISLGVYEVYPTPTFGGPLYSKWRTTGPAVQEEPKMVMIERSRFDTTGNGWLYDYGFGWGGYW